MKNQKKLIVIIIALLLIESVWIVKKLTYADTKATLAVRSIDTMKISRDMAREMLNDSSYDTQINDEMEKIAGLGATHVAIATPYDAEFIPLLKRWVSAARRHNLHVWFRGNFSGWEGWFNYSKIDRKTHEEQLRQFLTNNKELFRNGDIFTSCPECENGGPGDPRSGDVAGFRNFLIEEYAIAKSYFAKEDLQVTSNYYSMNGDVALLVMDRKTTKALDGVIAIDHYVTSPDKLIEDIKIFAQNSGGKVVLGETGVPVPDINGDLSQKEQAEWMAILFGKLQNMPEVIGINYWVSSGGSTAIWDENGKAKEVANVIKRFYQGNIISVTVVDSNGHKITNAKVHTFDKTITPNKNGNYPVPYLYAGQKITVQVPGVIPVRKSLRDTDRNVIVKLPLQTKPASWWDTFINYITRLF